MYVLLLGFFAYIQLSLALIAYTVITSLKLQPLQLNDILAVTSLNLPGIERNWFHPVILLD